MSAKDSLRKLNLKQKKTRETIPMGKELTTDSNFEPSNDDDNVIKVYLDAKITKEQGHISVLHKNYIDFEKK